jgi:menaquinone-specific isochorismate synthase
MLLRCSAVAAADVTSSVAHTRRVAAETDLLAALPAGDDAAAWVCHGEGLVGWGVAAECSPSGSGRFAEAARWWRDVVARVGVRDEVGLPGSGPVAFVSLAFADEPGRSRVIVPQAVLGGRGPDRWMTTFGGVRPREPDPVPAPRGVRYGDGELPLAGYRTAVAEAIRRIRAGDLHKVVLAHDLLATAEEPVDPRHLLTRLAERYPSCWTFAVDGLVGATPELLLSRRGDQVAARLLAGTAWQNANGVVEDLGIELLASEKNRAEHAYGVESLTGALSPVCRELHVPDSPRVLGLANVAHLASDVRGTLAGEVSLLELAERVHPTAAAGGAPREAALAAIAELEGMDRGRYLGPVGWIDAEGNGELGVALRCAQLDGATARLYAGGGVVADSEPDAEVAEAEAKFVPIREALGG